MTAQSMFKMAHKILFIGGVQDYLVMKTIETLHCETKGRIGKDKNKWLRECLAKF